MPYPSRGGEVMDAMRIDVVTGFWEGSHIGFSVSGSQEEVLRKIRGKGVYNIQELSSDKRSGEGPVVSLGDDRIRNFLKNETTYLAI